MRVFRPLLHQNYAFIWSSDLIASVGQFVRWCRPWTSIDLPPVNKL